MINKIIEKKCCIYCKNKTTLSVGCLLTNKSVPMCEECYKNNITTPLQKTVNKIKNNFN